MALGLLVLLAIQVSIAILGRLLTGRVKRPKAQPFESPRVEEGASIPVVYGIQQISGLVTFVQALSPEEAEAEDGTPVTYYYAKMQMALCWGEIDFLYDIIDDERAVSLQTLTGKQSYGGNEPYLTSLPFPISHVGGGPARFRVSVRQMFGGNKEEGGLQGELAFYWGTGDQPIDPLIAEQLGDRASAYPFLAHVIFGAAAGEGIFSAGVTSDEYFYWSANQPAPKPISFLVGRYPCNLLPKVTVDSGRVGGQDANPAEVLYDMFTNKVYGRGWSADRFNLPQWQAKAQEYKDRGVGFSGTLTSQMTTEDFIDECQSHADCLVVTNPLTGLLELKTLLNNYDPDTIPVVTKKNTRNFHQSGGTLAKTLNEVEVKYRKFLQAANKVVDDEVVTLDFGAAVFMRYKAQAQNLTNLTVWRVRSGVTTDITGSDLYSVNLVDGEFLFLRGLSGGDDIIEHDEIHIAYTGSTTFSGFVDASEKEQNLANWQATGSSRSEAYDYPWLTSSALAREKAIRLRKTVTRDLPVYKFEGNREFAHLTEGDVVKVVEPKYRLNGEVIRLTKIGYGSLESPWVPMEGIRDLWGESLTLAQLHGSPEPPSPPVQTITAHVGIYCGGNAIRMTLLPEDTTYNIEVQRATDGAGTGATTITAAGGIAGTSTFIDDPQTVGTTWYYRARAVRGTDAGPWSVWAGCTAVATEPPDPTYIEPEYIAVPRPIVDTTGTLDVTPVDPQGRTTLFEFATQIDGNAISTYATATLTDGVYTQAVEIDPITGSTVYWRATYLAEDGGTAIKTGSYLFTLSTAEPPPPPEGGLTAAPFEIVGHRSGVMEWRFDGPVSERTILSPEFSVQDWFPLDDVKRVRITYSISESTCSVGASVGWDYKKFDGSWGDLGPFIGIDPDTIAAAAEDGVMRSEWSLIPDDAATDVRLRPVKFGGDGTGEFFLTSIALQGQTTAPDLPPPTEPEPPTEQPPDPDPCEESGGVENFDGYADVADFEDDANWGPGHPLTSPEANPPLAHLSTTEGESPGDQVLSIHVAVAGIPFGYSWSAKGPTGFPCAPGDALQLIVRCRGTRTDVSNGFACISQASRYTTGGSQATLVGTNQSGDWETITVNRTSNNTAVWAHIGMPYCGVNNPTDHFIVSSVELKINGVTASLCGGTNTGGGGDGTTGGGGGGDEPVPPPPDTAPGERPMGMWALPASGWGNALNLTVKGFQPTNTAALITTARDAGSKLWFKAGDIRDWLDGSGKFQYSLWKAKMDAIWNNPAARAALLAGIADGTIFGHLLIDEPYNRDQRYGGSIAIAVVEQMAIYSKSLMPTLNTVITGVRDSIDWWMTRHITDLDWLHADYCLNFDSNVAVWRDRQIAFAADLGHGMGLGPHYKHIQFPSSGSRYITSAELRAIGKVLVTPPTSGPHAGYRIPFSFGWEYYDVMFAQAGWNDALLDVHSTFTSYDL